MTLNPADIAAGGSLIGLLVLAVKGGRMAGAFERGLEATTETIKAVAEDLKDFKVETTKEFSAIAEKHLQFAVIQERHTLLISALEQRVLHPG